MNIGQFYFNLLITESEFHFIIGVVEQTAQFNNGFTRHDDTVFFFYRIGRGQATECQTVTVGSHGT